MPINNCDKITMKKSINWIFIVIALLLCEFCMEIKGESDPEPIPLVRLPSNTLLKYTAYKDVSILHFVVPSDTRTAYFNFKAYEETKSAFRKQIFERKKINYYNFKFFSLFLRFISFFGLEFFCRAPV